MKFTIPLTRQNLYRMMRNQFRIYRKRRVIETASEEICKSNNLEVIEANDFVKSTIPRNIFDFSSVVGLAPVPVPKDENHPLYKEQVCYVYHDNAVLLEGLQQALVLTNTVQLQPDTLPVQIENLIDNVQLPNQDELVKRCIKTSCLFDAEQKKSPFTKFHPKYPLLKLAKEYGITEQRKNRMLCSRLVHLCSLANPAVSKHRVVFNNAPLSVPLQLNDDLIQFKLCSDIFLTSDKPLPPFVSCTESTGLPLPELQVSHPLISLQEENFYELKDVFPLEEDSQCSKVHTIFVHFNSSEVKNIFETPVTETQVIGRSLLKAFAAGVAQARYNYGPDIKDLPEPVVVQCVQTDSRCFHFSVLQLNTTDLTSNCRNVFWNLPSLNMYEECSYNQAVPTLSGYNPNVFKYLMAFYMNNP